MTTMLATTLRRLRPTLLRRSALAVSCASSTTTSLRWLSTETPVTAPDNAASLLPEHIKFRMPDLDFEQISGGSATGVTLAKWHAREGDVIKDGSHMCEIDTPDLVFVLDAGDEGYLARILVPAETKDVPPGQPLAIIVPTEADVARFQEALKQNPRAIEGYVEPTDADASDKNTDDAVSASDASTASSSSPSSSDADDGAAMLRTLHKLHKDGHFADEAVFKTLKSLARKNDAQLLVTYRGSFDGDAFDADFFAETASELAHEAASTTSS